jgi:hypothetical protein
MAYLILADYKKQIQTDNLAQIIGDDYKQVTLTEQRASQELISYLVQKYDMLKEFTETTKWSYGVIRKAKERFYLDAPVYSILSTYPLNSLCTLNGNVYICATAITVSEAFNANKWTLLGAQYDLFFAKTPNSDWDYYTNYESGDIVFFKDKIYTALTSSQGKQPDINSPIWGAGVSYTISATVLPTDTSKFEFGDNRNQQIVGAMVDIVLYHLHSRIAPHNVPALRFDRYKDVMAWLKNCAKGDDYTLDVPKLQPHKGMRNQYGSSQTKSNNNV